MNCRPGCGACCTAPSISTPMPGLPHGKPAGVACLHLDLDRRCVLFGRPERPACCGGLQPAVDMCGETREHALHWLTVLERETLPVQPLRTISTCGKPSSMCGGLSAAKPKPA